MLSLSKASKSKSVIVCLRFLKTTRYLTTPWSVFGLSSFEFDKWCWFYWRIDFLFYYHLWSVDQYNSPSFCNNCVMSKVHLIVEKVSDYPILGFFFDSALPHGIGRRKHCAAGSPQYFFDTPVMMTHRKTRKKKYVLKELLTLFLHGKKKLETARTKEKSPEIKVWSSTFSPILSVYQEHTGGNCRWLLEKIVEIKSISFIHFLSILWFRLQSEQSSNENQWE